MSPLFNPPALERDQLVNVSWGIISRGFAQPSNYTASGTLPSQSLQGVLFGLRAGDIVQGAAVNIGTAAAGTVPTSLLAVIMSSAGTVLFTSEEKSNATWTAGTGWRVVTYGASFTIPANGSYYMCWWQNGVFGTTPLSVKKTGFAAADQQLGAGPPMQVVSAGLASGGLTNGTNPMLSLFGIGGATICVYNLGTNDTMSDPTDFVAGMSFPASRAWSASIVSS